MVEYQRVGNSQEGNQGTATFRLSNFGKPRAIAGSTEIRPCTKGKAWRKAPNSIGFVARKRQAHSKSRGCPRSKATSPPCPSPTTKWGLQRTTSRSRTAAHNNCFRSFLTASCGFRACALSQHVTMVSGSSAGGVAKMTRNSLPTLVVTTRPTVSVIRSSRFWGDGGVMKRISGFFNSS